MATEVKFPVYLRVIGVFNIILGLIQLVSGLVLMIEAFTATYPSMGGFYAMPFVLAGGIITLICSINWLFGMKGSFISLVIQTIVYLGYVAGLIWSAIGSSFWEGPIVISFILIFFSAFIVVAIFYKPVREWRDQFEDRRAIVFPRTLLASCVGLAVLLPLIFIGGNMVITRSVPRFPNSVSYGGTEGYLLTLMDTSRTTGWSTYLMSDVNGEAYLELKYDQPALLEMIRINGSQGTSHSRLKDINVVINDTLQLKHTLADSDEDQDFHFGEMMVRSIVLYPVSVYEGEKDKNTFHLGTVIPYGTAHLVERSEYIDNYEKVAIYYLPRNDETEAYMHEEEYEEEYEEYQYVDAGFDEVTALRLLNYVVSYSTIVEDYRSLFYIDNERPALMKGSDRLGMYYGGTSSMLYELELAAAAVAGVEDSDALGSLIGVSLFENDPAAPDYYFRYVDPTFIKLAAEHLIPEPGDEIGDITCQEYYDYVFARFFRLLLASHYYLDYYRNFEEEVDMYQAYLDSGGNYAPDYLAMRYEGALSEYAVPVDLEEYWAPFRPEAAVGFWLRRRMDGSESAVWEAVYAIMEKYDYEELNFIEDQYVGSI